MTMKITLFFDRELASEERQLPAETYNLARVLLGHNGMEPVFVPIRCMQYLAIVDRNEIIFVDGIDKSRAALAWTDFHPQKRSGLQDPVSYTARYYQPGAAQTMLRLQSEFLPALKALRSKQSHPQQATLIRLFKRS
jgi:hypothetical protein